MLPAINRTAGMNLGFPDVCATPAGPAVVPIPYPNLAPHGAAVGFSPNVFLSGSPALSLTSQVPITLGDEGGVAHPTIKGPSRFVMGNPVVHVNFVPGICLLCPTSGNNMNNALGAVVAPGITNVFYTFAEDKPATAEGSPPGGALSRDHVTHLLAALAPAHREGGPAAETASFENGILTLRVRVFSSDVPARVWSETRRHAEIREIVLDLRDNPGGDLVAAAALAADFVPEGTWLFSMQDTEGDETPYFGSTKDPYPWRLTILVNRNTASAAEAFANALARIGRAELIGGPMFGKTAVTRVTCPPDRPAALAAVARVRLSSGKFDGEPLEAYHGQRLGMAAKKFEEIGMSLDSLTEAHVKALEALAGSDVRDRAKK